MAQNDFVPWATGTGANVYSVASYTANAARQTGVVDGEADPLLANNSWRQGTVIASVLGAFIAARNYDALDNGDLSTLRSNFESALSAFVQGAAPAPVTYPTSAYVHSGIDSSNTPGQIVANVTPDITGYSQGHLYIITANTTAINGGTTANLDARGSRTVVRADGSAVQAGDYVAGEVVTLLDDGARLQLAGVLSANIPSSNISIFTSSGTFTVPTGVTKIKRIRIWGAGGGGGGSTGGSSSGSGAGGGGYAELPSFVVTPGAILVATVGASGQGGAGGNGTSGGTSSLAVQGQTAFIAATGGGAGSWGNGGAQTSAAGLGGNGTGGGLNVTGGQGSFGLLVSGTYGSGIGGYGAFGGGSPTPNWGIGSTVGNFPGGGGNGGCGGSNGAVGGGGLIVFEY